MNVCPEITFPVKSDDFGASSTIDELAADEDSSSKPISDEHGNGERDSSYGQAWGHNWCQFTSVLPGREILTYAIFQIIYHLCMYSFQQVSYSYYHLVFNICGVYPSCIKIQTLHIIVNKMVLVGLSF